MNETLRIGPHGSLEIVSSSEEAFEAEATYRPGGSPAPAHFHPAQDERFEVLEGSVATRVDGEERELAAGERIEIGRGQVHQMWNPGEVEARVRWVTTPGGRTEEWFRALDGLFREGGDIAAGREVDFPALLEQYGDVFRLDL